ncbi:MAG: PIN domain-containing protein [Terriglobales bacterium]
MTLYLLDTCTVSDFFRGIGDSGKRLKVISPTQVGLSAITQMEVLYGFALNPAAKRRFEDAFLNMCAVTRIFPFDEECAEAAANIRAELKTAGKPIGSWDLLIGATALVQGCVLVTSNLLEFERIDGLKLENWR